MKAARKIVWRTGDPVKRNLGRRSYLYDVTLTDGRVLTGLSFSGKTGTGRTARMGAAILLWDAAALRLYRFGLNRQARQDDGEIAELIQAGERFPMEGEGR